MRVGLNFDEAEHAVVPSDQFDLASIVGCAEVLRDDALTLIPKMKVGLRFAAPGGDEVLRLDRAKIAGDGIQGTNDELGEPEHDRSTVNIPLN